jgi:hypothetical protein
MEINEFKALQDKYDSYSTKYNKLEGACEQYYARLKTEFEVETIEEAQTLLDSLEKEKKELEYSINKIVKELEELGSWDSIKE